MSRCFFGSSLMPSPQERSQIIVSFVNREAVAAVPDHKARVHPNPLSRRLRKIVTSPANANGITILVAMTSQNMLMPVILLAAPPHRLTGITNSSRGSARASGKIGGHQ
jgi:hypothetical protein